MSLRVKGSFSDLLSTKLAAILELPEELSAADLLACRQAAFNSRSADGFAWHYLRGECFSKFASPNTDLSVPAIASFLETERVVGEVNERLVDPWTRPWLDRESWLRAKKIVHEVLGSFPWESFPRECNFGPGASVGLKRRTSQKQNKWDLSAHITEAALPYHQAFLKWTGMGGLAPASLALNRVPVLVQGNRVTTVPKNWKTDRTIAIEPDWNMFFQKGVGGLIRRRLQRHGLLLRNAQNIAQSMAQEGSETGRLATIDLSAASDSISLALCEALLPRDWFKVITDLRSESGVLPSGETVTYAKVSSMGNGFTFELETLLFYALTLAVCGKGNKGRVHVYGDDIICPTEHAADVVILLFEAGFETNVDKTFLEGPFRESCGGHFWKGVNVTPFYHRRHVSHVADVILLANHITAWQARHSYVDLGPFTELHQTLRRRVPRKFRGPYGVDGALWSEWDEATPTWNRRTQSWKSYRLSGVMDEADPAYHSKEGSLLMKLWENSSDLESSEYREPLSGRFRSEPFYTCRNQWQMLPVR